MREYLPWYPKVNYRTGANDVISNKITIPLLRVGGPHRAGSLIDAEMNLSVRQMLEMQVHMNTALETHMQRGDIAAALRNEDPEILSEIIRKGTL